MDLSDDQVELKEHFLRIFSVQDCTGLTAVLLDMLTIAYSNSVASQVTGMIMD